MLWKQPRERQRWRGATPQDYLRLLLYNATEEDAVVRWVWRAGDDQPAGVWITARGGTQWQLLGYEPERYSDPTAGLTVEPPDQPTRCAGITADDYMRTVLFVGTDEDADVSWIFGNDGEPDGVWIHSSDTRWYVLEYKAERDAAEDEPS